jgi:hypothetical protein
MLMMVHHFSDGLYAKETAFTAGEAILKHTHNYSHLSILAKGNAGEYGVITEYVPPLIAPVATEEQPSTTGSQDL